MENIKIKKLVLAALFLALGLVLPFLTGQIPEIGKMLLPMHIPVLLCGFILGWKYGLAVGFILPIMRSLIFTMPPMYPMAISMAFELAVYGAVVALIYSRSTKKLLDIYLALVGAMVAGRVVWGLVRWAMLAGGTEFSWELFIAGAFTGAIPGIILQLALIPTLLFALKKAKLWDAAEAA